MGRSVVPVLPDWLIESAQSLKPDEARGVALGYAAAGWTNGYDEGFSAGFDAAMAAYREVNEVHAEHEPREGRRM
jgi:hypothetical protein